MSNEMSPYRGQLPVTSMPRTNYPALHVTRQGRALARSDKHAELQAREDYNQARLAMHRTQLSTIVEKAEAQARAELAQDAALHAVGIDALVTQLSAGKPALELTLRGIQEAHTIGEQQRILRRGLGI
jgi:hypothetical protein